jgi:hypothetical protein
MTHRKDAMNALDSQVGGDHYRKLEIPPALFIHGNGFGYVIGNIIKYACRYEVLGNPQDLQKIHQYTKIAEDFHNAKGYDIRVEKEMLDAFKQNNKARGGRQERDVPVRNVQEEETVEGDTSGSSSGRKDKRCPV